MVYGPRHLQVLQDPTYTEMVFHLKVARVEAGLNQQQVAERVGVSWGTLSTWERMIHVPSTYHLVAWWNALGFWTIRR